ncbi:MAG: HlyD family efflux transporter periplasmic adaptor subunit [Desulfovibrionaceae bacterium]|nr:HlyD family efflux transporter periplasmic adaptor subunit [Desulfovibrionaceae bacterium]
MPDATRSQRRKAGKRSSFILLLLTVSLAVSLVWLWLEMGKVHSLRGMVAGTLYVLTPHSPGLLEAVDAREGQQVQKGQVLARVRVVSGQNDLPVFQERTTVSRETLREQEERQRGIYESKVLEHVQAQLNLRSMDIQGGKEAVGVGVYDSAVQREQAAGQEKGMAREAYESSSMARAGIRQNTAQTGAGNAAHGQNAGQGAWLNIVTLQAQSNNQLLAPVDGRIFRIAANVGQMLLRDEAVLVVAPQSTGAAPLRILAEFPASAADRLSPGNRAVMHSSAPKLTLRGTVREVYPATDSDRQRIMVHLEFGTLPEGVLSPGQEVSCEVHGHQLFGVSELW